MYGSSKEGKGETATAMSVIKDVQWFVRSFRQTDKSGYTALHADIWLNLIEFDGICLYTIDSIWGAELVYEREG